MEYVSSPLNYTGGKFKLLPFIIPLLPKKINTFVDVFGGGFNVGLNVECNKVIYNEFETRIVDMFKYLHNTSYADITSYVQNIIKTFDLNNHNQDNYMKFRDHYNTTKNPIDLYILTFYSFSNMIGFNGDGIFNVSFGKRYLGDCNLDKLKLFKSRLSKINVEFSNKNFIDFDFDSLTSDDYAYCDPPYLITVANYNKYWDDTAESNLYNKLDELNARGVKFGVSNVTKHKGKTNEILLEWSKKYHTTYIDKKYNLSCGHEDIQSNDTVEVFITNYIPSKTQYFNQFI